MQSQITNKMKKLTDIIKENEGSNFYSYKVTLNISGLVNAMDEGSAGEEVDKEMDVVMEAIDNTGMGINNDGYTIVSIDSALDKNSKKVIDNNKVLESLIDADREGEFYQYAQSIVQMILKAEGEVYEGIQERNFVFKEIIKQLQQQITTEDFNDEEEYSLEKLKQNGIEKGVFVTEPEQIIVDELYCIVDVHNGFWTGGWKFAGKQDGFFKFTDALHNSTDTFEFTDNQMSYLIDRHLIAKQK